jgi:hypothetical protein
MPKIVQTALSLLYKFFIMKPILILVFTFYYSLANAATGNANDGVLFAGLMILITILPLILYTGVKFLIKSVKDYCIHRDHHAETN